MFRLIPALTAATLLAATAVAQSTVDGGRLEPPVLGRFFDPQAKAIRTLSGVPGATSAARLTGASFRYAAMAPHRPWALVDRAGANTLELFTFGRTADASRSIDAAPGVDAIVFSPSGDSALLFWRNSRVEIWRNFAATPERTAIYPLDSLEGNAAALAIADDASFAALILETGGGARLYCLSEGIRTVGEPGGWSAVAFAPGSRTAYVANRDTNEVLTFANFGTGGASAIAASAADGLAGPGGLAVSADGRKLVIANRDDPSLAVIDLDSRRSTVFALERTADGLFPLEGNAVFRLSAAPKPELFLLDADSAMPRITVVPVLGPSPEGN